MSLIYFNFFFFYCKAGAYTSDWYFSYSFSWRKDLFFAFLYYYLDFIYCYKYFSCTYFRIYKLFYMFILRFYFYFINFYVFWIFYFCSSYFILFYRVYIIFLCFLSLNNRDFMIFYTYSWCYSFEKTLGGLN
jgi:hypothetical protein